MPDNINGAAYADGALVHLSGLKAVITPSYGVVLTQKFIDGMLEYRKHWRGSLTVVMEQSKEPSANLDNVEVRRADLPFSVRIVDFGSHEVAWHIRGASVALITAHQQSPYLTKLCKQLAVPAVYLHENSLKTRLQAIRATTTNPLRRLRRYLWQVGQEGRNMLASVDAAGIQCNGTPTYDAYHSLSANPLLYFDTRLRAEQVITEDELAVRLAYSQDAGRPLRLAFSGRLDAIKGVKYLVELADLLSQQGVLFNLTIMGDGPLRDELRTRVDAGKLDPVVNFAGALPFDDLVRRMKDTVDVFVCPHVQGDPSCTYLETLACGVPIVGFANEAFAGLMRRTTSGWLIAMHDVRGMARQVATIARNRSQLGARSRAAQEFGLAHTFETTFQSRINHLRACARRT